MPVKTQIVDINKLKINKEYSKVAKIHKYWSRKPWYIIDQYIKRFTKEGELVFDPFMGSGSTGLEAIINQRNFVGYDLNPFSVFLTHCTLFDDYDEHEFEKEFEKIEKSIKKIIMEYYHLGNDRYLIYSILGHKNTKKYNAVTANYIYDDKEKLLIDLKVDDNTKIPYKFPDQEFPKKFYKDRFSYKGVSKVSDMFTRRNLAALSIIYHYIHNSNLKYKELFTLALSNTLLHVSKLKSENIRPLGVNNYWLPDDYIEENVWWRFSDRVNNLRISKNSIIARKKTLATNNIGHYKLHNRSALDLSNLSDNSVDYIFTDPPYGDAIQYSELSYIWNTWLNKLFQIEDEVIINPIQAKDSSTFNNQLKTFLIEASRVLKTKRYLTLCFQNKNIAIWADLAKVIKSSGFELVDISVYDTLGSPYNKSWAKYSPKSDFYITFKKINDVSEKKVISTISAEEIVQMSLKNIDLKDINIGKAYDEFVINLIKASFKYDNITNLEKLNIKSVVNLFHKYAENGNLQQRLL